VANQQQPVFGVYNYRATVLLHSVGGPFLLLMGAVLIASHVTALGVLFLIVAVVSLLVLADTLIHKRVRRPKERSNA